MTKLRQDIKLPYISGPGEISNEDYHRGELYKSYISSSGLKNYLVSPKYARWAQLHPELKQSTPAMIEGTIYHDLMESYTNYGNDSMFPWIAFDKPPINPRTGKPFGEDSKVYLEALAEFRDDNPGKFIGPANMIRTARSMVAELMGGNSHLSSDIRHLVDIGRAEQSHFCEFEDGRYKYRTDLKTKNKIIDWKKTHFECPKPENFERVIVDFGYHISAAMYQFFEHLITGRWKRFYWVVQENVPPYDFNIIDASPWAFEPLGKDDVKLNAGASIFLRLIEQHQYCLRNDLWPGYSIFTEPDWKGKRIAKSKVPGWYENKVKTTFYNDYDNTSSIAEVS